MPRKRAINLQFPLGGVNRARGFEAQPPFTSPDCLNVRPLGTDERRRRGGVRPGLGDAGSHAIDNVTGGIGVNLLNVLPTVERTTSAGFTDNFTAPDGDNLGFQWAEQTGTASVVPTIRPRILDGHAVNLDATGTRVANDIVGAFRFIDFDETQSYSMGMYCRYPEPWPNGEPVTYYIYFGLDDTNPNTDATEDRNYVRVTYIPFENRVTQTWPTGTGTGFDSITGGVSSAMLQVFLNNYNGAVSPVTYTAHFYWAGTRFAVIQDLELNGKTFGFGIATIYTPPKSLSFGRADFFELNYAEEAPVSPPPKLLVAGAGSNGYIYSAESDTLVAVNGADDLDIKPATRLNSVPRSGILYIADHGLRTTKATYPPGAAYVLKGNPASGTGGDIVPSAADSGFSFQFNAGSGPDGATPITNWQTETDVDFRSGRRMIGDVLVITDASDPNNINTYTLQHVGSSGQLGIVSPTPAGMSSGNSCSYRIERAPKIYDPTQATDKLNVWQAVTAQVGNEVPTGCTLVTLYRDRLVLAGYPLAPHVWFMSRLGNPYDFNYGQDADDYARAVAGTAADSEAGQVGAKITALVAHSDDYLIIGCDTSLWMLRGDPAYGGQLDNVSRDIGIVSDTAYTKTPAGDLLFLTHDGLYILPPGGSSLPEPFSREIIPDELVGVDAEQYHIVMEYDVVERGVFMFLTPKLVGTETTSWWIDWPTKTFWPVQLKHVSGDIEPVTAVDWPTGSRILSTVIFGCRDGNLRRFSLGQPNDNGRAFDNHVVYGPLMLGGSDYDEGLVSEIQGTLSESTGPDAVTWELRVADTYESALGGTRFLSGTWSGSRNSTVHTRARGEAMSLKLIGSSNVPWSAERIVAVIRNLGRQR